MDTPTLWDDPPRIPGGDPRTIDARFRGWMATDEGSEVVAAIRRYNAKIKDAGFQHYSIAQLAGVVRWHVHLEKGPRYETFKVNSVYLSRLARWLMERYPDEFPPKCRCTRHVKEPLGYFETRVLRS